MSVSLSVSLSASVSVLSASQVRCRALQQSRFSPTRLRLLLTLDFLCTPTRLAHLLTACIGAAATCVLPEGDHVWAGGAGQVTNPLQIALEHGHATAAEVIIKGAAKAGADISGSAEHAVDMLHKAAGT